VRYVENLERPGTWDGHSLYVMNVLRRIENRELKDYIRNPKGEEKDGT
jgi:hypothetical protein